jgi:hypothetical protein
MSKGKRKTSVVAMMAVLASLLVPMALASPASAVGAPASDFKICRGDVLQSDYLVNPNGQGFICAEASPTNYSGNGGKGWNEFDLVPFRLILTTGNNEAQSYSFGVAVDSLRNGVPGYDRITVPSVNPALSTGTDCNITNVGPTTTKSPGFTYDESIYRLVTVTLSDRADCVIDFDARIAIGAHLFAGASMHGNITDATASGTNQDRSIQTGELLPQALNKDMTAVRDVDHTWNITKSATPANVNLGDTCATPNPTNSTVSVSVVWTRGPATPSGITHITANIYATNPSHRSITASVVDRVYEGTTQTTLIHTSAPFVLVVPANTASALVGTDSFDTPSTATTFNDVATASYTDTVFNEPVPGQTTATDSADVATGNELNASAIITDVESIIGTGLSFSTDSVVDGNTGAGGAQALANDTFERPVGTSYALGTLGTAPVTWTSSPVSASGSVTFAKTVKFTGSGDVSGSLNDTASFATNSTPPVTGSANGTIAITTNTIATLTINKTTDVKVAADTVFEFTVTGPNNFSTKVNVTVPANSDSGSETLAGLGDGDYLVTESDSADWNEDTPKAFTISAGECADSVTFNNTIRRANILVDKVTNPAGSPQSFDFTASYNPAGFSLTDAAQPNNSGPLAPGNGYSVAETVPNGWDQTSATCSDGSPINNITLSPGETVTCTFTNRQRGHIIVDKVTSPSGSTQSFEFDPSYGANFSLTDTDTPNDSGALVPGNYSVAEVTPLPDGWDLTNTTCVSSLGGTESSGSIDLTAGETVTCTFTNRQRGHIIIDKVTDPSGSTQSFAFHPSYGVNFNLTDTATPNDSGPLVPNTYSVAEVTPLPAGWDLTSASCSDGSPVTAISLQAGETVTCTFYDRQRATIKVSKTLTNGQATTSFTFELRQGASDSDPGTGNDTGGTLIDTQVITANATPVQLNGFLVPGVYQVCEILPGPGWTSDLGGAGQFILTLNLDNSRVCADFTVVAGQNLTINVANTQPGGAQLTIGYWKNHASCKTSKGGQAAVLDQTLAKADPTGTTIGILTLHANTTDCVYAINILNKTTIDGKTKKASDPLFNMAAQLLAARLNVTGGAGTCPDSINAVNAAQTLLAKYGWNGLTYGPPSYPALTSQDAALANQLNNTLDLYNNGLLC